MGEVVKRVVAWAGAAVVAVVLTGCSIEPTPSTTSTVTSESGSTRATEPLAFGTFTPKAGISGDLFVEGSERMSLSDCLRSMVEARS